MVEWFEDEWLWTELYPFTFMEERLHAGADEVTKALALAGLTAPEGKALYGGLDGTPYGLDAGRLVAVARAGT